MRMRLRPAIGGRSPKTLAVLVMLGLLLASGCTGSHHRAADVHAEESTVTFGTPPSQVPSPTPDVTGRAKRASDLLVRLAGTIRSWNLAPSVGGPLVQEVAYADDALQRGNLLGARALLGAWNADVTSSGLLSPAHATAYRNLASGAQADLPAVGQVVPFKQAGAPPVSLGQQDCATIVNGEDTFFLHAVHVFLPYALASVPYTAGLLGGLSELIWPSGYSADQIWTCLQDEISRVVKTQIAEQKKKELVKRLESLAPIVDDYVALAQKSTDKALIRADWVSVQNILNLTRGDFESATPEYVALPEYAQFMNLELAHLRDGIVNGHEMGFEQSTIDQNKKYFTGNSTYPQGIVAHAQDWTSKYFKQGYDATPASKDKSASKDVSAFNAKNSYNLVMIPSAQDQAFAWPYFDPVKHPGEVNVPPNRRVLYSPAFGSGQKNLNASAGPVTLPGGPADAPVDHITVWASRNGDGQWFVRAWQLRYANGKPGPVYGILNPKKNTAPVAEAPYKGAQISLGDAGTATAGQAVVQASGSAGHIIDALNFTQADGHESGWIGNSTKKPGCQAAAPSAGCYSASYPGEILTYMISAGNDTGTWESPSSIVFGFQYPDGLR